MKLARTIRFDVESQPVDVPVRMATSTRELATECVVGAMEHPLAPANFRDLFRTSEIDCVDHREGAPVDDGYRVFQRIGDVRESPIG